MFSKAKHAIKNNVTEKAGKSRGLRRAFAVICAAAVIGTSIPLVSISAGAQTAIYASTTAYLNLRKGAGTNNAVVKVLEKNAKVTVLERTNKDWLKVRTSDGTIGYCSSEYLDIVTDAKATDYLNVRKGAGTDSGVIKTVAPGTKLDIIRFYGSTWAQVKLPDGTKGYVCTDYVSYISSNVTTITVKTDSAKGEGAAFTNSDLKKSSEESSKTESRTDTKISLTSSEKWLNIGKTCTLTAVCASGSDVVWSSENDSIATVTSKGVVTAVRTGTVKIVAKDSKSDNKAFCTVNVTGSVIDSIKLQASSAQLKPGGTYTLKTTVVPSNATVKYKTSNSAVATVSSKGEIKAVGGGTADITAYDPAGAASAVVRVTVKVDAKISISASSISIKRGTSKKLTASISDNSAIKWTSSNTNVAAVNGGIVSGLNSGTAVITASDSTGNVKASCKVTVNGVSSSGVSLSRYSASTTAGKTIYIKGYGANNKSWGTSDSNIATVWEGFILAKKAGKVAITYTNSSGNRAICVVTVYESAPIKYTYSSPNSAVLYQNVTLTAITDKTRTDVRFEVDENGKTVTVNADKKVADGNTYVWTGTYKANKAGTFNYRACGYKNGKWVTCNDGKADIYVTTKTDHKTTSLDKLRASDALIRFIGEKEGFVSKITYDTLANNVPTLAHGYVVWEGDTFYNGLTAKEGYALLVSAINKEVYASRVNEMLTSNNIRFNQQQFDALVTFSYNLGTGWTYSSDLKDILLNSYGTVSSGSSMTATVNSSDGLNLRSSYTTSSSVLEVLDNGEKVTLLSTQKYNSIWYKVKTSSGKVGFCSSSYLNVSSGGSKTGRDLNYVNKNALIRELLAYHHAGGVCYYGLLYRRVDELEMFLYGDYVSDGRSNKHNFPSPSCLSF